MNTVVVASKNPVKISASRLGFERMFPDEQFTVEGVAVPSNVSNQPMSDAETYTGAKTRALNAKVQSPDAEYWIGIEGGVALTPDGSMEGFAWIIIFDRCGRIGKARTGTFLLPKPVTELIKQGKELGEADDIVFGQSNSKQLNGAVGLLTDNVIDRTKYYTDAVVLALIPLKKKELY